MWASYTLATQQTEAGGGSQIQGQFKASYQDSLLRLKKKLKAGIWIRGEAPRDSIPSTSKERSTGGVGRKECLVHSSISVPHFFSGGNSGSQKHSDHTGGRAGLRLQLSTPGSHYPDVATGRRHAPSDLILKGKMVSLYHAPPYTL